MLLLFNQRTFHANNAIIHHFDDTSMSFHQLHCEKHFLLLSKNSQKNRATHSSGRKQNLHDINYAVAELNLNQ